MFQVLKSLGCGWPEEWAWGRKRSRPAFERAIRRAADSSTAIPNSRTINKEHAEERQQNRILWMTELCGRLTGRAGAMGGDS